MNDQDIAGYILIIPGMTFIKDAILALLILLEQTQQGRLDFRWLVFGGHEFLLKARVDKRATWLTAYMVRRHPIFPD
jgi:hypothetical protein